MSLPQIWLGADPEAFIHDRDQKPVPAWRFFPDKFNRVSVWSSDERIKVFHDGSAVEFNGPPSTSIDELTAWMRKALIGVQTYLPEQYTVKRKPTVSVDADYMKDAPPIAMSFGCDPDWNAWDKKMSSVEMDATTHPHAYAGGHMHISVDKAECKGTDLDWLLDEGACMEAIKVVDLYLGVPLTVIHGSPETFLRRKYYGKAGSFRFQDYGGRFAGLEYRVPGPEVWDSTEMAAKSFKALKHIITNFKQAYKQWDTRAEEDIRHAIDTGENASAVLQHFPALAA